MLLLPLCASGGHDAAATAAMCWQETMSVLHLHQTTTPRPQLAITVGTTHQHTTLKLMGLRTVQVDGTLTLLLLMGWTPTVSLPKAKPRQTTAPLLLHTQQARHMLLSPWRPLRPLLQLLPPRAHAQANGTQGLQRMKGLRACPLRHHSLSIGRADSWTPTVASCFSRWRVGVHSLLQLLWPCARVQSNVA
ncbi:hypothetical protein DUNSADRAFT_17634 [Dunaliella salina]|uniref:Secreted protein n=1 Tax=Dunaliella salina TaxID=3046 RepID=A0ABQ7GZW7_DUNSA|nr:hypothetical protein DUNSADRAFT_17634 [Dunaliella salina]|eukprot:KAF5840150.1 hypothetical protein DUNSADRAFT_17634 [Dunaliella salina]